MAGRWLRTAKDGGLGLPQAMIFPHGKSHAKALRQRQDGNGHFASFRCSARAGLGQARGLSCRVLDGQGSVVKTTGDSSRG